MAVAHVVVGSSPIAHPIKGKPRSEKAGAFFSSKILLKIISTLKENVPNTRQDSIC